MIDFKKEVAQLISDQVSELTMEEINDMLERPVDS